MTLLQRHLIRHNDAGGRETPCRVEGRTVGIDDIVDKAKDIAGDVAAKAKDVAADVAENAKEFAGDVKEFAGDAVDKAKDVIGDVKDHFDGDDETGAADDSAEGSGTPTA
jgi:hypothetical protein